ncbi:MAG: hypothetical protein DRR16_13970 [Candidatus Parabeggiatoa sp. nov. 3]|jgi:hypothetical protein|nr:MAG: hypothetical protein DRR00_17115 [Gammaproteobacteria bacterium]RKZ56745.1 MAG: hypothetical protein DRQ99_28020 [Gammaproteobacteria bacterium]RKZ84720.1 MAG: hypothetical protein DRR16_13970 [Gammaproteobacteria bacterium]
MKKEGVKAFPKLMSNNGNVDRLQRSIALARCKHCKVSKTTLYREEPYSGSVSCTVLKTSQGWKQFGLSLTAIQTFDEVAY